MPLSISSAAIAEKNKLSSSGVWVVLLQLDYNGTHLYFALNNEDVIWNSITWLKSSFKLGQIESDRDGGVPSVKLQYYDVNENIAPVVDENDGIVGAIITIRVVNSTYLTSSTAEFEEEFEVLSTNIDSNSVISFELGTANLYRMRMPPDIYLRNYCRYKTFKGTLCGYSGEITECNRSYAVCDSLGNTIRFGGFPGIDNQGILV